jgi:ketosteroid isomerase-like protein
MVLGAGACAFAAAAVSPDLAGAHAEKRPGTGNEDTIRRYYAAWETKEWHPVDILLADDFTFSSPLDDHISKSDFKTGCWDTQIAYISRFDLKQVIGTGSDAFVMYICHTTNGKTFRNVEYFQLRDSKVRAVECYFGGKSSFPSAVSTGKV